MAENVMGTGVEGRRRPVVVWIRSVVPAYAAHAAGVLWVAAAANAGAWWSLLAGSVFLGLGTIVLDATLRRQRRSTGTAAIYLRLVAGVSQLVIGLVLVRANGDGWKYIGLTSFVLLASTVLGELRYSLWWVHTRGLVALGVAALLVMLGLWPIAAVDPLAGVALAGFGLIALVLGVEMYTEDWLRSLPRRTPRQMRWGGALLLAVSAAWLVRMGSEPAYVGVGLLVLVVLVAAVSSDGDSGELILLVIVAIVWATLPRSVPASAAVNPRPGEPFFVALGDSYISGEGAERFFDGTNDKQGSECRRAPTAYPVELAEHAPDPIPDRVLFLACSGALSIDLHGARQGRTEPVSQLDQYAAAVDAGGDAGLDEADLEFVLLSIGGNDAQFGTVGRTCVGPGDCSEIGERWLDELPAVRERLGNAYDAVDDAFDVPVHVVPYPMPLAEDGCWWSWLTNDEHRFLSGFVHELNSVISAEAREHGFDVVETMETTFVPDDLRICDRFWPVDLGMNFVSLNPTSGSLGDAVNPRNWIHNSLHPNEVGHAAMAGTVERWINTSPPAPADEVAAPRAEACAGAAPPPQCDLLTSEWESIQVRSLLRSMFWPVLVAFLGIWWGLMPTLRWATENQFNLASRIMRILSRIWARVRTAISD